MKINPKVLLFLVCFTLIEARQEGCNTPGGICPEDPRNADVQLYLREAVKGLNDHEHTYYVVKRVVSSSVQVVEGVLYRINAELSVNGEDVMCHFEAWDRPWNKDGREVKVSCDDNKAFKYTTSSVSVKQQRKVKLPGSGTEIPTNDEFANRLLRNNIKRLSTGDSTRLQVVSVDKIMHQVVEGDEYVIEGVFKHGSEEQKCTVNIWYRPWIATVEGTQISAQCEDGVKFDEVHMDGVPEQISRTDETANNLLRTNMKYLTTGDEGPLEIVHINYIFKLPDIGGGYLYDGLFKQGGVTKQCNVTIPDRPWVEDDAEKNIDVDCKNFKLPTVPLGPGLEIYSAVEISKDDPTANRILTENINHIGTSDGVPLTVSYVEKIFEFSGLNTGKGYKYEGIFRHGGQVETCTVNITYKNRDNENDGFVGSATCKKLVFPTYILGPHRPVRGFELPSFGPGLEIYNEVEISKNDPGANELLRMNINRVHTSDDVPLQVVRVDKIFEFNGIYTGSGYKYEGTFKHGNEMDECTVNITYKNPRHDNDGFVVSAACNALKLPTYLLGPGLEIYTSEEISKNDPGANELLRMNLNRVHTHDGVPLQVVSVDKIFEFAGIHTGKGYKFEGTFKHGNVEDKCTVNVTYKDPWHENDGYDVTTDCADVSSLRYGRSQNTHRFGAATEIPTNNELANNLLRTALARLSGYPGPVQVVRVNKITKQVVSGDKYTIEGVFRVDGEDKTCTATIWHRAWIQGDAAITLGGRCNDGFKLETETASQYSGASGTGLKRQVEMLGGEKEIPKTDEMANKLLRTALARLVGYPGPVQVVRVNKIMKQIVAGDKYTITGVFRVDGEDKTCTAIIWYRPWVHGDDGTALGGRCEDGLKFTSKSERRAKMYITSEEGSNEMETGGRTELPTDNEMANNLLRKNLKRIATGNEGPLQVVHVDKIYSKVISGIEFTIDGVFKNNAGEQKCTVDIWYRPWLEGDDGTEISAHCGDGLTLGTGSDRSRRNDGSAVEISKDDETANNLLRKNINRAVTGNRHPLEVVRVDHIYKQVVDGVKYTIKAIIKFEHDERSCTITIWYKPWIEGDIGTKISGRCDPRSGLEAGSDRPRRNDGSPVEISKNDETANNLLKNNLKRVSTGNRHPLEIVRIDHIYKQVVDGEKYTIKGVLKDGNQERNCTISIWYRSWIQGEDGTKIRAICDN